MFFPVLNLKEVDKMKTKILIFIIGACTGVAGSYYFLNKKLKKQYEQKLTEALLKDLNKEMDINDEVDNVEQYETYTELVSDYTEDVDIPEETEEEKNSEPDWLSYDEKKTKEKGVTSPPYLITVDEYEDNDISYDKCVVFYHPDALTVVDNHGDIIEDVDWTLGFENLKTLNDRNEEIFIRNEYLSTDYDVMLEDIR